MDTLQAYEAAEQKLVDAESRKETAAKELGAAKEAVTLAQAECEAARSAYRASLKRD